MTLFDFSTFPILTEDRVALRELLPSDAQDVFAFRSDPEVQKYNSEPMTAVSEALGLIEWSRARYVAHEGVLWGLTLRDVDRVIGLFGFNYWDQYHNRAEIGFDLARAHWGKGLAAEALGAMLSFGFGNMQLHRIEAETIADNTESVRLLERLGFHHEGTRREYSWEDDSRYHDNAMYGLLRHEFVK